MQPEKRRFGSETVKIIYRPLSDKQRRELIDRKVRYSFDKSRDMVVDMYRPKVGGVSIHDEPLDIVSPEFDALMIGRSLANAFTSELPRIILKKKNNNLPIGLRTQMRFSNMGNAAKNEAVTNAFEGYIENSLSKQNK